MLKMVVAFAIGILLTSCESVPESKSVSAAYDAETVGEAVAGNKAAGDTVVFDPKHPPVAIYTATMLDIQDFVQELDRLIKAKDYDRWLKLLSSAYLEHISSKEFLDTVSQQPRLKSQNIVLQNSRDYFLNVVVLSRSGLEADDIEFLTMTRVMAFTINQQGQRIRIYTLDKTPESWEIVD